MILGIDIGGTKTALCLGNRSGEVVQRVQFPSRAERGFEAMLSDILATATEFSGYEEIGVSIGGPLDAERGVIQSPPNLPGWVDVPLKARLEQALQKPCWVEHDAKAGALAEWLFGAGQGCRSMVFLTLGTGLGAGVIADGRLLRCAGEVGHWRIATDGPLIYGKAGSWEGWSSGTGVAAHGDIREGGRALGRGLALLIDLLSPERIVLGNLVRRLGPSFREPALEVAEAESLPPLFQRCQIVDAALGEGLGDVAALSAALYHGGTYAGAT